MLIKRVTLQDDLAAICAQMTPDNWAKDNEMTRYDPAALKAFLKPGDNFLVLVYKGNKIAGAGTANIIQHPAKDSDSLFVNEIDTHPDHRRKGVATLLMQEMFKIAKEYHLDETWVGADEGNEPAHKLYQSLHPDGLDPNTIYDFKTK